MQKKGCKKIKRKEKYEKITLKDLKKYANDIFIAKNLSLLIQTNLDKKLVKNSIEKMIKTL